MKVRNLLAGTARVVCVAPGAQAGTNAAITPIDTAGYESITFLLIYAAGINAANTPVLSATYGNKSNGSDQAAVPNTATAALTLAASSQSLELTRPTKRYVAPVVTCNGSNEYYAVIAILTAKAVPGGPLGPQGPRVPGEAFVPQTPSFSTSGATAGEFTGGGYVQTPLTASEELATILASP